MNEVHHEGSRVNEVQHEILRCGIYLPIPFISALANHYRDIFKYFVKSERLCLPIDNFSMQRLFVLSF